MWVDKAFLLSVLIGVVIYLALLHVLRQRVALARDRTTAKALAENQQLTLSVNRAQFEMAKLAVEHLRREAKAAGDGETWKESD